MEWETLVTRADADAGVLHGVACPSPTRCFAVGSRQAHGDEYNLIENYG